MLDASVATGLFMTSPVLPDVNWNELVIARVHEGHTTVWTAWKRALSAFADPAMYRDPSAWAHHFTEHPNAGWGPAGYGLIVVNLDTQTVWSANDYQFPGSFQVPSAQTTDADGQMIVDPGLLALLNQPEAWPHATLKAFAVAPLTTRLLTALGLTTPEPQGPLALTFDRLVSAAQSPAERLAAVTQQDAQLMWQGQLLRVVRCHYTPPGWTLETDGGRDRLEMWDALLTAAHQSGMPAPVWESVVDVLRLDQEDAETQAVGQAMIAQQQRSWATPPGRRPALR